MKARIELLDDNRKTIAPALVWDVERADMGTGDTVQTGYDDYGFAFLKEVDGNHTLSLSCTRFVKVKEGA